MAAKNWHSIQQGMLLDSDIFSIIIDPKMPTMVLRQRLFGNLQERERRRSFSPHPGHTALGHPHPSLKAGSPSGRTIVYAGTTGGLWKTFDGGTTWELYSAPNVIVNDILIDPRQPDRVLLATDRGGVLASDDGFDHYSASNRGFSHRVVGGVVVDHKDPNRLYVGVVNDKDYGGFFLSDDAGQSWRQSNKGLDERDILSLQQADNDVIFAGTNHGIFYLPSVNGTWLPATMIMGKRPAESVKTEAPAPSRSRTAHSAATASHKSVTHVPKATLEAVITPAKAPRVRFLEFDQKVWYAATDEGLFRSVDQGKKWYGEPVEGESNFIAINRFDDGTLTLVSPKRVFLSKDEGESWTEFSYPAYVTGLYSLTVIPDGSMWLGTREGALHSTDGGKTWQHILGGLPPRHVLAVRYDTAGQRLLATALFAHGVFESKDGGQSWQRTADSGVSIRTRYGLPWPPAGGLCLQWLAAATKQGGGVGVRRGSFRRTDGHTEPAIGLDNNQLSLPFACSRQWRRGTQFGCQVWSWGSWFCQWPSTRC